MEISFLFACYPDLYLAHVVDCARDIGYSDDEKLIADCSDFLDSKAQVRSYKLGLNLMYYFTTLVHFVVDKLNKPSRPGPANINDPEAHRDKVLKNKGSPDINVSSTFSTHNSSTEGRLSIKSDIRKMIYVKVHLLSEDKVFSTSQLDISFQDFQCYKDAQDTLKIAYSDYTENSNEVSAPFAVTDVDQNLTRTKKRGQPDKLMFVIDAVNCVFCTSY